MTPRRRHRRRRGARPAPNPDFRVTAERALTVLPVPGKRADLAGTGPSLPTSIADAGPEYQICTAGRHRHPGRRGRPADLLIGFDADTWLRLAVPVPIVGSWSALPPPGWGLGPAQGPSQSPAQRPGQDPAQGPATAGPAASSAPAGQEPPLVPTGSPPWASSDLMPPPPGAWPPPEPWQPPPPPGVEPESGDVAATHPGVPAGPRRAPHPSGPATAPPASRPAVAGPGPRPGAHPVPHPGAHPGTPRPARPEVAAAGTPYPPQPGTDVGPWLPPAPRPAAPAAAPAGPASESAGAASNGPAPRPRKASRAQREQLQQLGDDFAGLDDRVAIARFTCSAALDLIRADEVSLLTRAAPSPQLLWQAPFGADQPRLWGPDTLAALVAVGEPVRMVLDGDPLADGARTALLCVPLPVGGDALGVLIARRGRARTFSAGDADALERLARIAGAAVFRAEAARNGDERDDATGLRSGGGLRGALRSVLASGQGHGMPTSVVMFDVRGLDDLLDQPVYEAVLRALGGSLNGGLRAGDLAYRFSADELAVLLPGTSVSEAQAVGDRLAEAATSAAARVGGSAVGLRAAALPVLGSPDEVIIAAIRALAALRVRS